MKLKTVMNVLHKNKLKRSIHTRIVQDKKPKKTKMMVSICLDFVKIFNPY